MNPLDLPLLAAADDIRDIRPEIPIPEPTPWALWVAAAGGLLLLALLVFALAKRWRGGAPGLTDRTLAQLARARAHAASGDAYAFAVDVSQIVRRYLEARFGLPATQQTTPEFLHELAERPVPALAGAGAPLDDFLEALDAAKYARYELPRTRMDAMVHDATRLVEATRPVRGGAA